MAVEEMDIIFIHNVPTPTCNVVAIMNWEEEFGAEEKADVR